MNRRLVLAIALVVVVAPQTFASTWLKNVAAAQKVAKQKNQLILVDMFAEWCGWCHRFEKEVYPSAAFQAATTDLVLLKLDTEDRGEGTQLARRFEVTSLPTFLLLTPDLTMAGVIRGFAPAPQFVEMLKGTRKSYDSFLARSKNEPNMTRDYPGRLELAKEYLTRFDYEKGQARLKKLQTEKGVPASIRDEAYYQLAVSYAVQRKLDESLKTIRELTALSKLGQAVEKARVLSGQIYAQQGNILTAANELRDFKKTYPNSLHIHEVNRMLANLEQRLANE